MPKYLIRRFTSVMNRTYIYIVKNNLSVWRFILNIELNKIILIYVLNFTKCFIFILFL